MTAPQAIVTRVSGAHGPAHAEGSLGPSFVLEAQARLSWMLSGQAPHVAQLRTAMARQVAAWDGAGLERALSAHLAAVAALRFELLVSPGLRAGPLGRDEAAFRQQVTAVSACTEATWAQVRQFLEQGSRDADAQSTFSDFILEMRSIQRGVAELGPQLEQITHDLNARQAQATSEVGRRALAELACKAAALTQRLQLLRALQEVGHAVQKIGWRLDDESGVCRETLRKLGRVLSHGLLERLRALIVLDHFAPEEEMRAAQLARTELQVQLAGAIAQVTRLQECQRALAGALARMGAQLATLAASATPAP